MRNGFLHSIAALLASAGLALAGPPGTFVQVLFEDADQSLKADGSVMTKPGPLPAGLLGSANAEPEAGHPGHAAPAPEPIEAPGEILGAEAGVPGAGVCGPPGRFWVSAEYLLWWIRDSHLPPLVTAGPVVVNGQPGGGVLGAPGTVVLFGGSDLDHESFSGGRFTAGLWLDCCHTHGLEGGYFFLGSRTNHFVASSTGSQVLSRPFFDITAGAPSAELIGFPGGTFAGVTIPPQISGLVEVSSRSRLQGAELNGICNLCCRCNARLDLLGGFRWLQLDEDLVIREHVNVLPTVLPTLGFPFLPGNVIDVFDEFSTRNDFYGGQLGLRGELRRGRVFVDVLGKVALGDTHSTVDISGGTVITTPAGAVTALPGGLLALTSNIGHYSRDHFSVVPEVGVNVGYQVSDHLRAFIGYTFLYWTDVVQPGDQIDLNVNPLRVPTNTNFNPNALPARPAFAFHDTDFWAQGVNVGLEFRY